MENLEEITIRIAKDREEDRWNDAVNKASDAWIYHRLEWRSINTAYDPNWKPYYFVALDRSEEIIGVFPTFVVGNCLFSLPMGACGPCCRDGTNRQLVRSKFMDHIDGFCKERDIEATYIELPNLAPGYLPPNEKELLWPASFGYGEWKPNYTYLINWFIK